MCTFKDFKNHLKSETPIQDIRLWLLTEEMAIKDFVESFNHGIADNLLNTYEFPGQSLEKKQGALLEEYNLQNRAIFVEVKRSGHPWIFNLDYSDSFRFYEPKEDKDYVNLPYMPDSDNKETYFDQNFSYNLYWKVRNNCLRDYFDTSYLEKNIYQEIIDVLIPQAKSEPVPTSPQPPQI